MFRIKICGVTTAADAHLALQAGADAIGLNFYASSPRCLTLAAAREVRGAVGDSAAAVGVFVNAPAADVVQMASELQLHYIQIHGDEPPEYLSQLGDRPVIRAFRCRDDGLLPVNAYLAQCQTPPAAVLIDAYSAGAYGGTGRVVDWPLLAGQRGVIAGVPLILAGGLTAENIGAAIATVRPVAVDTASGVESSPGVKNAIATQAFVAEARRAFASE